MKEQSILGLIDYGSGNLRSVRKALESVGASVRIVEAGPLPNDLGGVVLPGVGSFGDAVRQLRKRSLFEALRDWVAADKPYLGICLGYQLLFDRSEESPEMRGLAVLPGAVRRFPRSELKVPQIGWNTVSWSDAARARYPGLVQNSFYYFVHSYYPEPADASLWAARTDYGGEFAAGILKGNVLATQFHPEKSQSSGLQLLGEFIAGLP